MYIRLSLLGFEGRMWYLTVLVTNHRLPLYCACLKLSFVRLNVSSVLTFVFLLSVCLFLWRSMVITSIFLQ